MLPIWLSSFRYKEKIYRFMVNGQTGRVGGNAPISPLRNDCCYFIISSNRSDLVFLYV